MRSRSIVGRKLVNSVVTAIAGAAAVIGLLMLLWILFTVVQRGIAAIDWSFFTTTPDSSGGGLANAIVGTLMIAALATVIGVPIGMLAGVYLAEFGQNSRFASTVRFVANVLIGAPSIVIGVFIYTIMVVPTGHFSGLAGSVSLAIIMLPVITRTTEDMLRLVPSSLRESALALGAPEYKMVFHVLFRAARGGLLTGVMLAVARVSGETAPLLFTALNNRFWSLAINEPTANLTVTTFQYAMSPTPDLWAKAWGASLLITVGVLLLNLTARFAVRERKSRI